MPAVSGEPRRRTFQTSARGRLFAETAGRRKGGDRTISAERQSMVGSIGAKLVAVLAAAGIIFYSVAYVSDRGESDGIRSRVDRAVAPGTPRRSSSLEFLQRRAAEKDACASGSRTGDCSHLAQREAVPGASAAKPQGAPSTEIYDPPNTGTVNASAKGPRQERLKGSRRMAASVLPRPSQVAAKSRAHQAYARRHDRTVRWTARQHRWPGVAGRYSPRVAYTPWWMPTPFWSEPRGN
jgi:hypothetical protein